MQFRNPIEIGFKLVQLKVFRIMNTPILLDMMSYSTVLVQNIEMLLKLLLIDKVVIDK